MMRRTSLRRRVQTVVDYERQLREPRRRVKPVSTRKRATDAELDAVRPLVLRRDLYACRLRGRGPCSGALRVHHIRYRSRSRIDQHAEANLTAICDAHHAWVHAHDEDAHTLGLALHGWEPHTDAWVRMHSHGLAVEPVPSRPPTNPAKGYGSLCAACSAAGAPHQVGHNWFCDRCASETYGEGA